jgi:hypothetical protein
VKVAKHEAEKGDLLDASKHEFSLGLKIKELEELLIVRSSALTDKETQVTPDDDRLILIV